MKEQKRVRHPRKAVLEAIALGLEEIEAHFELEGFSARNDEPIEEKSPDEESQEESNDDDSKEEDDDEDEDEEYSGSTVFQREDIEVAIDVFISRLVEQGVIKKIKLDEQPSLSKIFEIFFGEGHELTEAAKTFEEHVEGYFGAIAYDDMNQAFGQLAGIRDMIKREMNRHAEN